MRLGEVFDDIVQAPRMRKLRAIFATVDVNENHQTSSSEGVRQPRPLRRQHEAIVDEAERRRQVELRKRAEFLRLRAQAAAKHAANHAAAAQWEVRGLVKGATRIVRELVDRVNAHKLELYREDRERKEMRSSPSSVPLIHRFCHCFPK